MSEQVRRGFVDLTDFDHEIGEAPRSSIYATEADIERLCADHIEECGYAEVEVRLVRIVKPRKGP